MIDFTKYTLPELQAMSAVLDDLTYRMSISEVKHAHMLPFHYYKEVTGAVTAAIDQQARDHAAAEAEKVNRIKEACVAGAPPAEDPAGLCDLQSLVDDLSRCSSRLAALAHEEDEHFAESSQMNDFLKASSLYNANRSIIDLLADIRDHYDGLH